jgi:hypothetical protein
MSKNLSQRRAAKIYNVLRTTRSNRLAGRTPRPETKPNRQKLSKLEEGVIIRYILDLDSRGFAPRLASVEDIVNYILESRGRKHVGKF